MSLLKVVVASLEAESRTCSHYPWGHQALEALPLLPLTWPSFADLTRMIHILDTEHPWDVHSINSEHSEAITCLEWDQSGEGGAHP